MRITRVGHFTPFIGDFFELSAPEREELGLEGRTTAMFATRVTANIPAPGGWGRAEPPLRLVAARGQRQVRRVSVVFSGYSKSKAIIPHWPRSTDDPMG